MRTAVARLKRRSDFLRVAAARRKWAAAGLILQVAPRQAAAPGIEAPQASEFELGLGFTVSRKVGNAVKRNRARRRLRAAAEQIMPLHARPGRDYVLIGRRETLDRPYSLLLQDLQTALKRLGAYRDDTANGTSPE